MTKHAERQETDEQIAKTVLTIQERDGVASPDAFIEAVADEDHPLHGLLEWDDAVAGHEYRKHQSRHLIGRVKLIVEDSQVPAFVHITISRDGGMQEGYVPFEVAVNDESMSAQMLAEAASGVAGWSRRLAGIRRAGPALVKLGEAVDLLRDSAN